MGLDNTGGRLGDHAVSMTYSLRCPETKLALWVGQQGAGSPRPWLYKTDRATVMLEAFLVHHRGKQIIFGIDVDTDEQAGYRDFADVWQEQAATDGEA